MVGLEDDIDDIEMIPINLIIDDLNYNIIGVFIFYESIKHYIFKLYDGKNYLTLNNSPNISLLSIQSKLVYVCYEYIHEMKQETT